MGKFRMDLSGLQLIVANFWRNRSIVTLFDHDGNVLAQEEPVHYATPLIPANWKGDGQELAMLSAKIREGVLIDGHPTWPITSPTSPVISATRSSCGTPKSVWIYTRDRPFSGDKIFAPVRLYRIEPSY
jgi:hypothetical protein